MTSFILIAIVVTALVVAVSRALLKKLLSRKRQRRNIRRARRILEDLRNRQLPEHQRLPVVLGTLRKIDPFVLEELVLTCCHDRGWKIIRNRRYTGDGGFDGKVIVGKQLFLVQVKRYRDHINPQHVREFQRVVTHHRAAGGLFVHTGKTGRLSKAVARDSAVSIVSGGRLVEFVLQTEVHLR